MNTHIGIGLWVEMRQTFKSGLVHRTVPPKLVVLEHTGQPRKNSLQTSSIHDLYISTYITRECASAVRNGVCTCLRGHEGQRTSTFVLTFINVRHR